MGKGLRLTTKPPRRSQVVTDEPEVLRGMLEFAASGEDVPIAMDQIRALHIDLAQLRTIPTESVK